MSMQFCKECNNLLKLKFDGDIIQFVCSKCETTADLETHVIYQENFKTSHGSSSKYIKNLLLDSTLPRFEKTCTKCSNRLCISYMEKSEKKALNSYYICTRCLNEWND